MTDPFVQRTLSASLEARQFIKDTGGLPEITQAANDLIKAIDQTAQEIDDALLASRFSRHPSDYFRAMVDGEHLPFNVREAIAQEGEAGYKRVNLQIRLEAERARMHNLINNLVELRTDLIVSQQEM